MRVTKAILHFLEYVAWHTLPFLFRSRPFKLLQKIKHQADMRDIKLSLGSCGERISIHGLVEIANPSMVHLGNDVSLGAYLHIWGGGGVEIGDKVMIGPHTSITSLTHDYTVDDMYHSLITNSVIIDDNVWIGTHCVIMPGIHIHTGAVIGSGSVVTHDVEQDAIMVGVPARLLKKRRDTNVDPTSTSGFTI